MGAARAGGAVASSGELATLDAAVGTRGNTARSHLQTVARAKAMRGVIQKFDKAEKFILLPSVRPRRPRLLGSLIERSHGNPFFLINKSKRTATLVSTTPVAADRQRCASVNFMPTCAL